MNKLKLSAIGLALTLGSMTAQADIVEMDLYVENDNGAFLDERTGLEWVDLDATISKSINTAVGLFSGFRVASRDEVLSLFDSIALMAGPDLDGPSAQPTASVQLSGNSWSAYNPIRALSDVLGHTKVPLANATYVTGWYQSDDLITPLNSAGTSIAKVHTYKGTSTRGVNLSWNTHTDIMNQNGWGADTNMGSTGVFLVSDGGNTLSSIGNPLLMINNANVAAAVSAPAALGFLSTLMLGFGFRRKS